MSRPENKNYTNGKATVVAYTMAMLASLSLNRYDLLKVWDNQGLSDNTKIFLNQVCDKIYQLLSVQVVKLSTTILSYGKTKGAYDFISSQPLGVDIHLLDNDLV